MLWQLIYGGLFMRSIFNKATVMVAVLLLCLAMSSCKPKPVTEPTDADRTQESANEPAGEKGAEKASLVDKDLPEEYPFPGELPDTVAGKNVYVNNCSKCHGEKGDSGAVDFTADKYIREKRPFELYEAVSQGRDKMPSWKDDLTEVQMWSAVYYIWTLHSDPGDIDAGLVAYGTICASCHSVTGNGQGSQAASGNVKPPDFNNLKWMNGQKDNFMAAKIKQGSDPMPGFSQDLDEDQLFDVIDYIRTFSYGPKKESTH